MGRRKSSAASGLAALFVLCVASLALFTIYVKEGDSGPLHTVQLGAAEVLRPVRSLAGVLATPFAAAGERLGGNLGAKEEEALRLEAQENAELAAQASRLEQENARLRDLLEGERYYYEYGPLAQVVAPVGEQFTDRIFINIGTADGIRPEQPVVVGNNTLVGRTTSQITAHTAEVMLVSDQEFAAGVRTVPPANFDPSTGEAVSEDPAALGEGLLRHNLDGYLGVDFVDLSARVEKGDFVVTSGRSGDRELLFPPGLLVGTVESVSSQDIDQFKKIVVDPALDPDNLQEVRVIVGW